MSVYVRHKLNGVGRGDWLAMRKEGIGGSDSSVILGLNPFASEMELWMDKVGSMPEKPASEAMRLGNELEDYVARRFCEETGKKVRRRKMMLRVRDISSAMGKAVHTSSSRPVWASSHATGSSTTSCRATETIRE